MVNIRILSETADSCLFEEAFVIPETVPSSYFHGGSMDGAELRFLLDLLEQNGILVSRTYQSLIWLREYHCRYHGVDFSLIYDEDDDMVWFSLQGDHTVFLRQVAEAIKQIIQAGSKGEN